MSEPRLFTVTLAEADVLSHVNRSPAHVRLGFTASCVIVDVQLSTHPVAGTRTITFFDPGALYRALFVPCPLTGSGIH